MAAMSLELFSQDHRQRISGQTFSKIGTYFLLFFLTGATVYGGWVIFQYEATPGETNQAPLTWPLRSSISFSGDKPVLLMFIHPECPCSQASLSELEVLLSNVKNRPETIVVYLSQGLVDKGRAQNSLLRKAAAISGVRLIQDKNGTEAKIFNARTSGYTVLYGTDQKLVFNGGITGSRGHVGDNPGRLAAAAFLDKKKFLTNSTPTFGCALFNGTNSGDNP